MAGFFNKIGTSFTRLWAVREKLNLKNIRPAKTYYAFAYAFVLTLANMQGHYFMLDTPLFGIPARTMMYASHVVVSVVVMLLWSERFKWLIRFSTAVMLVGLFPLVFLPQGILKTVFCIVCWAGLGGCATAARVGFAFGANNVERLLAVFGAFAATDIFYVLLGFGVKSVVLTQMVPILLVIGITICLNLYREKDLVAKEDTQPSDRRTVYLAMAYMIAFYAIDGFASHLIDYTGQGIAFAGFGSLFAIGLFIVIHMLLKKSVWHIWNLVFTFSIIMAALAALPTQYDLALPRHLFLGMTLVGAPTSLYMLGGVQKRYSSVKLLKKCTILLILFLPAMILGSDLLALVAPGAVPLVTLLFVIAVFVGFTLAAPATYKYLFSADWMDDFHKPDMTRIQDKVEQTDLFENYALTPREKEVAALLLAANTVRMIAGELKLSQSTVNMHTSNLYRKLGINSKAELFRKFGVADETARDS